MIAEKQSEAISHTPCAPLRNSPSISPGQELAPLNYSLIPKITDFLTRSPLLRTLRTLGSSIYARMPMMATTTSSSASARSSAVRVATAAPHFRRSATLGSAPFANRCSRRHFCRGGSSRSRYADCRAPARVSKTPHPTCREPPSKVLHSSSCCSTPCGSHMVAQRSSRIGDDPGFAIPAFRRPARGREHIQTS